MSKKRPLVAKSLSELRDLITLSAFQPTPEENKLAAEFFESAATHVQVPMHRLRGFPRASDDPMRNFVDLKFACVRGAIIDRPARVIRMDMDFETIEPVELTPATPEAEAAIAELALAIRDTILKNLTEERRQWWSGRMVGDEVEVTVTLHNGETEVRRMQYDSAEYQALLTLPPTRVSPFYKVTINGKAGA